MCIRRAAPSRPMSTAPAARPPPPRPAAAPPPAQRMQAAPPAQPGAQGPSMMTQMAGNVASVAAGSVIGHGISRAMFGSGSVSLLATSPEILSGVETVYLIRSKPHQFSRHQHNRSTLSLRPLMLASSSLRTSCSASRATTTTPLSASTSWTHSTSAVTMLACECRCSRTRA